MTQSDIATYCKDMATYFGYPFDIPVEINGRLSKTLGRVLYKRSGRKYVPIKIEFSKELVDRAEVQLEETIMHEMAHYFVLLDTGENHNHDDYWKTWAKRLGCSTRATVKNTRPQNIEDFNFEIRCSRCNKVIGRYKRAGKVVKEPYHYKSKCCQAKIKVLPL